MNSLEELKTRFNYKGIGDNEFKHALANCVSQGWMINCGDDNYTCGALLNLKNSCH